MKKMFFSLILVAILFSTKSFAQENVAYQNEEFPWEKVYPQCNNNIGLTASYFSGVGIHYKRFLAPDHSIKAVFFGWRSTEEETGFYGKDKTTDIFISFGLEYHYHFLKMKKYDFYTMVGYRTWYEKNDGSYYSNVNTNTTNSIGVGVGLEYRTNKHFVINWDIGFANMWKKEYNSKINTFSFAGGIGIGFVF